MIQYGTRIISEEWVNLAEKEQYDLYPLEQSGFWGKGGMNGQMTMFNREKRLAVAWLGHETNQESEQLLSWFSTKL